MTTNERRADGLLKLGLPEPDEVNEGYMTWHPNYSVMTLDFSTGAASETENPNGQVWTELGGAIAMDTDHSEMHLSASDARALALALLAAADYAEKETPNE